MARQQPELTRAEKLAGRLFRDIQQANLLASFDTAPPTFTVLPWHKNYRHECSARNNVSTALELQERYVFSPEYVVFADERVEIAMNDHNGDEFAGLISSDIQAGRFGFIYKEGICRGCKATARSRAGRLVDAHERPPLEGRVAR